MCRCIESLQPGIIVRFNFPIFNSNYFLCSAGNEKEIEKSQNDCQIVCDAYEESNRLCSNKTEQVSLSLLMIIIIVIHWIINK